MHNIETIHHKKRVAAENGGFTFKADFFKSVPLVISFKPLVSDSKPTSSNQYRSSKALVVMDNIDTLLHHKSFFQKPLVSDSKQTSPNEYR